MANQVIRLADYRHQRDYARVQESLNQLYWGVLQTLGNSRGQIHPDDLETFFVEVIADHLMANFASMSDVESLAQDFDHFDNRLRMAICDRLANFNATPY